jgi:hypothetical protein
MEYRGKIDHDIEVTGEQDIGGQMNGTITVREGGRLRLSGQTNGRVEVLQGGFLHQSGQLNGALTCRGWADITGQINGTVVVDRGVVLVAEGVHRRSDVAHTFLNSSGNWVPCQFDTSTVVSHDARRWQWNDDGSMTPVSPT